MEIEELDRMWKASNANVPNESKIKEEAVKIDKEVAKFLKDHWQVFINAESAVSTLVARFNITDAEAKEYVKAMAAGKGEIPESNEVIAKLEARIKEVTENYIKDIEAHTTVKAQANEMQKRLDEIKAKLSNGLMIDIQFQQYETGLYVAIYDVKTKRIVDQFALDTSKQQFLDDLKNNKDLTIIEENKKLTEQVSKEKSLNEAKVVEVTTLKEQHEKEVKELKEKHEKALIECYTNTRINSLGLKLPGHIRTLFESCKTPEEVESLIETTQDRIRENSLHSSKISELIVKSPLDPAQAGLLKSVGTAMRGMGKA
jgi:sulfur relay (sulfurtransferase) DsrC/TusE family protein